MKLFETDMSWALPLTLISQYWTMTSIFLVGRPFFTFFSFHPTFRKNKSNKQKKERNSKKTI